MPDPIATELAIAEPLPLDALSAADREALLAAIRAARAEHARGLETAITNALESVPRVLRGALRKVLF